MSREHALHQGNSLATTHLIRGLRSGHKETWDEFVEVYTPLVYRWARQAGLQCNDASDISQDVFRVVARKIDGFGMDPARSCFRLWLWGITRNILRQFFRSRALQPMAIGGKTAKAWFLELPEMLEAIEPVEDEGAEQGLAGRALHLIRRDFRHETWQAFWRLTMNDERAADIGKDLGMTAKAVRQAKYRVLCRLRDMLIAA